MPALKEPREEAFAAYRAMGHDLITAAEMANISLPRSKATVFAQRLADRPDIAERVKQLSHQVAQYAMQQAAIDRAWVINELRDVYQSCREATPVMIDGLPSGQYRFDSRGALSALKLLGMEIGMFRDNPADAGRLANPYELMPEDQLRIEIEAMAKVLNLATIEPLAIEYGPGDAGAAAGADAEPGGEIPS